MPSTLKVLENSAFIDCANLKTVELSEGLEVIGAYAFFRSGIESVTIPTSLKEVYSLAFASCANLKTIYVKDGCRATLCQADVPETTLVGPLSTAMAGKQHIWDLRNLR